jgi:hypothetical protein
MITMAGFMLLSIIALAIEETPEEKKCKKNR